MNLAVLFGLATVVMPAFAQREAAEEKAVRPNFVFFLVDDLGYMDVGANNPDSFYETPHIDRLAATGERFRRARHQHRFLPNDLGDREPPSSARAPPRYLV